MNVEPSGYEPTGPRPNRQHSCEAWTFTQPDISPAPRWGVAPEMDTNDLVARGQQAAGGSMVSPALDTRYMDAGQMDTE